MKKALYIVFIIAVLVIAGLHVQMFIREYKATTLAEGALETSTINNYDGSYLMLFNPGESVNGEITSQAAANQKSILITVPYNLRGARYIPLDGYYTKMDYQLKETTDGIITEVNLYNGRKQEKLTLEYNNAGAIYSEPRISTVDESEIPSTDLSISANKEKKIALSKGTSYVEIPDYFEIQYEDYLYVPIDFVQFTNISNAAEKE